ncbi:MAG TPA: hypothetical protein VGN23_14760 [Verrucomicrobiae bacterium]|jgi:hypothetical protein
MKISLSDKNERAGFALLLVLFTLVAMTMVFGSTMLWMSSSMKQTAKNNSFTTSQAAAEGVTEMAFAEMDRDFLLNVLQPASYYYKLFPDQTGWPIQFTFSDTNGVAGQISIDEGTPSSTLQPLGTQYANLEGAIQTVTVTATATPQSQLYNQPATVQQQFSFAYVPAFQFAIFYNINLEIDPGASMPITGAVFSNGGIWSGNANPTYSSTVEAVGGVSLSTKDPFLTTYTDAGTPASNFTYPGQPTTVPQPLEIPIGASTNNSETNVLAIIQIPPSSACAPTAAAYAQTNQVYTYNEATLVVSNWSTGTFRNTTNFGNNFVVYLQDPGVGPSYYGPSTGHFNQLTNDFYIVTNNVGKTFNTTSTNTLFGLPGFASSSLPSHWPLIPTANCGVTWTSNGTNAWGVQYAGWSFLTNVSFYDYREGKTVQAVQIDVSLFRRWITNAYVDGGSNWNHALAYDSGQGINSVYVYNSVPLTSSTLPAVRMINGLLLPNSTNVINNTNVITSGLSVATAQPLYVYGSYNVQTDGDASSSVKGETDMTHTYPAGFLADAITILSGSWRDSSYTSSTTLTGRTPASTGVNAAMLEGIVQSSTSYPHTGGVDGYSGGVENFMRLLENWGSSYSLTYNGSIMVMFSSQYATNWWQTTGNYYNAPKRVWSFDTNFLVQNDLPPMTPEFTTVIRSNYNAY